MCLINASNDSRTQAQGNDNMITKEAVGYRGLIWWAIAGQIMYGFGRAVWLPITVPYIYDLMEEITENLHCSFVSQFYWP